MFSYLKNFQKLLITIFNFSIYVYEKISNLDIFLSIFLPPIYDPYCISIF